MHTEAIVGELQMALQFFKKSSACLQEKDSEFAPADGTMTVAQQIAHTALSVDWFIEGAFDAKGFDMDFENHMKEAASYTSLEAARTLLDEAFGRAVEAAKSRSPEEWAQPLPEGPVMGGLPRFAVIGGITDHTAHHRGALTVYSRLCGHTPEMPY